MNSLFLWGKKKKKKPAGSAIKHCYLTAWEGNVLSGTHLLYGMSSCIKHSGNETLFCIIVDGFLVDETMQSCMFADAPQPALVWIGVSLLCSRTHTPVYLGEKTSTFMKVPTMHFYACWCSKVIPSQSANSRSYSVYQRCVGKLPNRIRFKKLKVVQNWPACYRCAHHSMNNMRD